MTDIKTNEPAIVDGVLYGCDNIVMAWVQAQIGEPPVNIPIAQAFAIMPPEEEAQKSVMDQISRNEVPSFYAGCYWFNHKDGQDIDVCVAVADIRAANPKVIRKVLEYPFADLDLPRVTAYVHKSNTRSLENCFKLGFVEEGEKGATGWKMLGLYRETCWIWNRVAPDVEYQPA